MRRRLPIMQQPPAMHGLQPEFHNDQRLIEYNYRMHPINHNDLHKGPKLLPLLNQKRRRTVRLLQNRIRTIHQRILRQRHIPNLLQLHSEHRQTRAS